MSALDPDLVERFRRDANLFVAMLDAPADRLLLTPMTEADYAAASFLDQRLFAGERPRQWVAWSDLAAVGPLPDDAGFIFHIGHVGSTLIARLLGALPTVLSVREPLLLRNLAELILLRVRPESPWSPERFDRRLVEAISWLSRSFRDDQQAIVKATSFASELAAPILQHGAKALFLHVAPETYFATILAGDASRQELATLSGSRLVRLHGRLGAEPWKLWVLSEGERAALAWACEMTTLEVAAATASPDALLRLDFDDFLKVPASLTKIAGHFGHRLDEADAATITGGEIMRRYSKAPEHGYSPALRRDVLAGARVEHQAEIAKGMRWLEAAGRAYPLVAAALESGKSRQG